jgi:hypothetical protein
MIKLLHLFLFENFIYSGPGFQDQSQFDLAPQTFGLHHNIQFTNKLKSNKLIN